MTCDRCGNPCKGKYCVQCGQEVSRDVDDATAKSFGSPANRDGVKVCPECQSAAIVPRQKTEYNWKCRSCNGKFDDAGRGERRNDSWTPGRVLENATGKEVLSE